ncbi:hypothetical protein [Methanobrevibacter wolinii]|uniref:hypothetical protein n=1 Tax=Methanobrevibacter wolinii TaxID=190977 RepID=UPI0005B2C0C7|nr:hypothetical protein [Methanobrevibacter wolinii]MDD5960365.1 hypothetical protein [Methanobrevibacter wolinii]
MELNELKKAIEKHDYNKNIKDGNIIIKLNEPHEMFLNNINLYSKIQKIILNKNKNNYIIQLYDNEDNLKLNEDLSKIKSLRIYLNL